MNPFYFGPSERPLFGLYTQGRSNGTSTTPDAGRGVLLCYPVGSEYLRAHRAFRQLNTLLNRAGIHVLRFDYSCTGDSGGAGDEADFDQWIEDVDWALDELMDTAGLEELDLIGLRWGATLAALAARERDEVRHMILWDPIVDGSAYFNEVLPDPPGDCTVGIEGYPFSAALRERMGSVDLRAELGTRSPQRTSVIGAEDDPRFTSLAAALESRGDAVDYEVVPSPGSWAVADPFGDALIPQDIIRSIVDRLATRGG